ncbi:MAG: hypothetical protein GEV03_07780 [Streptosporangiales bacterium]|nr:hypothetical protein [Streptosporangiales bacterium]
MNGRDEQGRGRDGRDVTESAEKREIQVVLAGERGRPGGVAALDDDGRVPESQLPARLTEVRHPTITLDELTCPLYIPHRGGAKIAPENTIDALRAAVELGFKLVEVDCSLLRDGGLMVMHDATPNRTSNLHGTPDRLTTQAVLRGRINAGEWFCPSWPSDLLIPALSDVLREVGNHICLLIEVKNAGSGRAAVDLVTRSELGHSVIIESFRREELDAGIEAGLPVGLVHETGEVDPARLRAEGVDYLAVLNGAPEANITAAVEAGLCVFVYDVDRRYQHDRLAALGVGGFITDDPMYLSGRLSAFGTDPYVGQTFWHGCLPSEAGERGRFTPPDWWGYPSDRPGYRGALQGWGCPVPMPGPDDPPGRVTTIGFDVVVDSVGDDDTTHWASIFFGSRDDRPFSDRGDPGAPGGYHALLRADGELALYRVDAGEADLLGSVRTPPLELGRTVSRLEVRVGPAEVAVTRVDAGPDAGIGAADTTYRGGYFQFGRDGAAARFRNAAITRAEGDR